MSATNRGAKRVEQDSYQTPRDAIEPMLRELVWEHIATFGEPCSGDGNILLPISTKVTLCWDAEITDGKNYLTAAWPHLDLIMTNPPFSLAQEFLEKSLREAETVIYLLRLNFLGSQKRKKFWQENPPSHLFVLSKRPQFVDVCKSYKYQDATIKGCGAAFPPGETRECPSCGNPVGPGSDATEYAWFVWRGEKLMKRKPGIYVI